MNPSAAVATFVGTFLVILGLNAGLRLITRGVDSALHFSWLGIGIAAAIAVVATLAEQDRRTSHENRRP